MRNKKYIFLFILTIAIVQFIFQWLVINLDSELLKGTLIFQFLINLPICIFIGIIDFFIINTVYKVRYWKDNAGRILTDLLLTNSFIIVFAIGINYLLSPLDIDKYITRILLSLLLWNTTIVLFIEIFFYNQRQVESDKRIAMIEKEKLHYQYETLKAQVNPHFLFNSLNVLSSLAYENPEKTNLFAKRLSRIYRYVLLSNNRRTVPVSEELSFLESYIFLEKIRFDQALFFEIINTTTFDKHIIPVCLQLLAENATKHNIATSEHPLNIRIEVTDDNIIVSNNLQLKSSVEKSGYGLKNIQKQYDLYGKNIQIVNDGSTFKVILPYCN